MAKDSVPTVDATVPIPPPNYWREVMESHTTKKLPIIFILSGAGLSAESGLRTFRGDNGLWKEVDPSKVDSATALMLHPEKVFEFMNERIKRYSKAQPNAAHRAIAEFCYDLSDKATVINVTQNVDSLLEMAGCPYVHHLHGSFALSKCSKCGKTFPRVGLYGFGVECPVCHRARNNVRPSVVLFEEQPYGLDWIIPMLRQADYFLAIGTSGNVYPAAGFVSEAKEAGCKNRWLCNMEPVAEGSYNRLFLREYSMMIPFNKHFFGKATETVPKALSEIKRCLEEGKAEE